MEQKIDLILSELKGINRRVENIENRVGNIESQVGNIENRVGNIESQVGNIENRVGNIETELKAFRTETKTSLQIIQAGQKGTRQEITQRFKEVKHSLGKIEPDVELTYHKTVQLELEMNRLKSSEVNTY